MIQAKTYYCGNYGGVRKLVDLVGAWVDVSLPAQGISDAANSELLDIAVDPNNGDHVIVVGDAHCDLNWFGIGVSTDGGLTWNIPNGNYQAFVNNTICYYKWNKVSVVNSNVIYVCGVVGTTGLGIVVKSLDGGLTFNTCASLPNSLMGLDCNSIHFTSPLVGVVGLDNYIIKTIDGGNTWTILNGGLSLSTSVPSPGTPLNIGAITGIHIKNDESSIIAIGEAFVFETTPALPINTAGFAIDSWVQNAYPPYGFGNLGAPLFIGKHLSFLNPAVAGDNWISVSGLSGLGMESGDHGNSWNFAPAPGYDPTGNGFNRVAAHFYKLNVSPAGQIGFYNKDNVLYAGNFGFNPSFEAVSDTSPFGINSVWTWYFETPPPVCYRATNCDGSFIVTDTDLSVLVALGAYFNIVGYAGCFAASINEGCSGSVSITVGTERFADCASCNPPPPVCYQLLDCSNQFPPITTNTNLSAYLNQTVVLSAYPGICWQVIQPRDCSGSTPLTSTIVSNFVDCPSCLEKCYTLTDCKGTSPVIITNTDLSAYVGKVIKLAGCSTVCYIVTASDSCTGSITVVLNTSYDTCALCDPIIPPPPVKLKTRKVQPNYGNGLCSIDIIEKINCNFASQVYNKMLQKKYGITICVEDEFDKYLIKKEVLDLNLISDPNACKVAPVPDVCPDVPVVPPIPIPCSAPTNVVVSLTDPPSTNCDAPVIDSVQIVYQISQSFSVGSK